MEWTGRTVGLRGWEFEDGYGAEPTLLANVRLLWTGELENGGQTAG
jgi:hypothetical protein